MINGLEKGSHNKKACQVNVRIDPGSKKIKKRELETEGPLGELLQDVLRPGNLTMPGAAEKL